MCSCYWSNAVLYSLSLFHQQLSPFYMLFCSFGFISTAFSNRNEEFPIMIITCVVFTQNIQAFCRRPWLPPFRIDNCRQLSIVHYTLCLLSLHLAHFHHSDKLKSVNSLLRYEGCSKRNETRPIFCFKPRFARNRHMNRIEGCVCSPLIPYTSMF